MDAPTPRSARDVASLAFKALLLVGGTVGLLLALDMGFGRLRLRNLNFFTDLSALVALAYLAGFFVHQLRSGDASRAVWCPAWKYSAMMGLTLTCIVATALLGGGCWVDENGASHFWETLILHYLLPGGFVADWLLFDEKGRLSLLAVAAALGFSLAYVAYALVRVAVFQWPFGIAYGTRYPYDFLDLDVHSVSTVATTVAVMTFLYALVGVAYWALDRWLAARRGATQETGRHPLGSAPL